MNLNAQNQKQYISKNILKLSQDDIYSVLRILITNNSQDCIISQLDGSLINLDKLDDKNLSLVFNFIYHKISTN